MSTARCLVARCVRNEDGQSSKIRACADRVRVVKAKGHGGRQSSGMQLERQNSVPGAEIPLIRFPHGVQSAE